MDNSKKIKVLALSVAAALHGLVGLGLANMTIKPLTIPPITPPLEIEFITIEPPPKPVIFNNLESAAPPNEPMVAQASKAQMSASLQAPAAEVETEPKQSTQDEPEPEVEQKTEVEPDIEPEPVNELAPDPEPEVDLKLDAEQLLEQRRLQEAWEAHQRQLAKLQEQQRLENEHREQQRLEQERLEQERLENVRREQERLDHERREQERLANEQRERLESERQAREQAQREAREKVERQAAAAAAAANNNQNAGNSNSNSQGGGGQNNQNQVVEGGIGTISDASWRTKPRVSNFCSSRKDVDMTVQVSFRVDAEGKISNVSLNGSTGDRNLDRQITRQVGRGRLHPFKEGNVTRVGRAIYPIVLRLQKDEACTN